MLIGFFLRRIITLTLCAGSFWLGMKTDRILVPKTAAAPVAADCPEVTDGN
ncbi:hypothetical protein OEZ71_18455 [Defluviimonas sp. WL0050]|uniref:Uncharacterized protein n=1 Tax=Albidovulum litorale TaxID=2984134 RepID=A0ABT2ZTC6_9RHOB|nr:hypothetical protein [Defluviimonas sp. WL0050]MCV2874282.1 hypothetical protein [Defluviimonas sp. WL0050]